MALNVPDTPDIETKTYENFKGVDYTNDPTNVWYRRSPSGVNMLPDASGRPFKRHGWEVKVSASDLATALNVTSTEIKRCFYFELAGKDHIILFCEGGVVRFLDEQLTALTTDVDFWGSSDRAFFFSGNGRAAFYIYGNYKVFAYEYDVESESYTWGTKSYSTESGEGIYIPQVLAGCTADGTGTNIEGYNLLGDRARYEYQGSTITVDSVQKQSCILFRFGTTGDFSVNVDKDSLETNPYTIGHKYEFTYGASDWTLDDTTLSTGTTSTTSGISTSDLEETYGVTAIAGEFDTNDTIEVVYVYGVQLPHNVSEDTTQLAKVRVFASKVVQFDDEYTRTDSAVSSGQFRIHSDATNEKCAWIEFGEEVTWDVVGEDYIRVIAPVNEVTVTSYSSTRVSKTSSATGSIVR